MPEITDPTPGGTTAPADLGARIRRALGFHDLKVRTELGETDRSVSVWSVRELDAFYARLQGVVTATPVTRTVSDGATYQVLELTVTVYLPGLGAARASTDWVPTDELHGFALRVVQVAVGPEVQAARIDRLHKEAAEQYAAAADRRRDLGCTSRLLAASPAGFSL